MISTELLIVGAGAAGLSCAAGAAKAGVSEIVIADTLSVPGGILPQCLHRGFGLSLYGREMTGPEFLEEILKDIPADLDLRMETTVSGISEDRTALLCSRGGLEKISFRCLVIAAGCREKSLYSIPVAGTRPAGVFSAGLAQQLVNLNKADIGERIVLLGSGDIGLVMAGRFAELGKPPVVVIEQKEKMGGLARNQHRYIEANHIPVITKATIDEIHGYPHLTGVTVHHLDDGQREFIPCDTLITALGLIPEKTLAAGITENGCVPDWLAYSGNSDFVHEIVDSVVREGMETGKKAAEYLGKR